MLRCHWSLRMISFSFGERNLSFLSGSYGWSESTPSRIVAAAAFIVYSANGAVTFAARASRCMRHVKAAMFIKRKEKKAL
ncbi:hypothetical protein ABEV38_07575 [Parageobacillus thermoglucosidasius]|mgnify:CR=1 FL=1|uniref:hypothetical protein n=1 Tax=Parageobacillus thermoglucosidasius TaxID=1426 RepID=UPI000B56F851|nr:hypothetical protein [Parageobacillus thermoglucosidasius]OUM83991.1 MAG: hypothetical protein BAA00_07705 [Parageobacillus thermoglucosidasius]